MSLKSIRESYSKLLAVFKDAGVALNESQKADLDTFVLALESNMESQRKQAIKMTKEAVEAKMEKEYREVFESVMANMRENARLSSKIQNKVTQIEESKKISQKVDEYLDLYVEKVLPKKTVVDYDRMRKLEKLHESLKDALVADEDAVQSKIKKLEESFKIKQSKCETEVAKVRAKLNESMQTSCELKAKLEQFKAMALLESKTKDLPLFEARRVKRQLKESSVEEIEKNFNKTLKNVREEAKAIKNDTEKEVSKTVESEINEILNDEVKEDDYLKNRVHNNHKSVALSEQDDFETMESVKTTDDGDVVLDESDIIDGDLMKLWCRQAVEVQ